MRKSSASKEVYRKKQKITMLVQHLGKIHTNDCFIITTAAAAAPAAAGGRHLEDLTFQ